MIKENKFLTEQQIEHFKTFGFLLLRGAFDSDDLNIINDEYEIGLKIKLEKVIPEHKKTKTIKIS